jgi:hypothetical protein
MHRADAATVSYTEVICTAAHSQMRYHAGSPCLRIHQLPKSKPQLLATTR